MFNSPLWIEGKEWKARENFLVITGISAAINGGGIDDSGFCLGMAGKVSYWLHDCQSSHVLTASIFSLFLTLPSALSLLPCVWEISLPDERHLGIIIPRAVLDIVLGTAILDHEVKTDIR